MTLVWMRILAYIELFDFKVNYQVDFDIYRYKTETEAMELIKR